MEERAKNIVDACMQEKSKNPVEIFYNIAYNEFVRIHGPEHHILDGASLLTAFYTKLISDIPNPDIVKS